MEALAREEWKQVEVEMEVLSPSPVLMVHRAFYSGPALVLSARLNQAAVSPTLPL